MHARTHTRTHAGKNLLRLKHGRNDIQPCALLVPSITVRVRFIDVRDTTKVWQGTTETTEVLDLSYTTTEAGAQLTTEVTIDDRTNRPRGRSVSLYTGHLADDSVTEESSNGVKEPDPEQSGVKGSAISQCETSTVIVQRTPACLQPAVYRAPAQTHAHFHRHV